MRPRNRLGMFARPGGIASDWEGVEQARHAVRKARGLPARFKAVCDYNAACCAFIYDHRWEIERMLRDAEAKRNLDRAA